MEKLMKRPNDHEEEILRENPNRFTLFPIKHHDIWKEYKTAEAATWTANEIDFGADKKDWETLNNDEKYFIEHILAFFAGSDGIVLENLLSTFSTEVQLPEARAFYSLQGYIENVHSEVYSKMIDTLITDLDRKRELFNAIETIPCVTKKANWAMKWMDPKSSSFAERLIGFIIVEGLFFSGSFCSIFWLKNKGKMINALAKSNEMISRDEGLHTKFGIMLYKKLNNKCLEEQVHSIFKESVAIETEFICESLPCKLIGMNSTLMTQYIKYTADNLLYDLGYTTLFNVTNPFDFMDNINLGGKSNFFEQRVTEYQRAYSVTDSSKRTFDLNGDF
jgi:ribonucleoside-diphosphate reductase subunit M2